MAENVCLSAVPIMLAKYDMSNTFSLTYSYTIAAVAVLWAVSIVCKYIFYKLWGHPWKAINGPTGVSYLTVLCRCQDAHTIFNRENGKTDV